MAAYVAAMIDGEGSVAHYGDKRPYRAVRITNTDYDLIEATSEYLAALDIRHAIRVKNEQEGPRSKCWVINITDRASLERVAKLPLRSTVKVVRLGRLLSSYTSCSKQRRAVAAHSGKPSPNRARTD
jgi:hypothetical protein